MTERLAQLLHDEVQDLDIPPAPIADTLSTGHRLVRRRRAVTGVAGLVAAVVLITGTSVIVDRVTPDSTVLDPMAAYSSGGAWSVGSTVHFGAQGEHTVTIDGAIKSMYYTSAGVVVRNGEEAFTDSAGPSHYALVTPGGEIRPLSIDLGDRAPDTDPTQPYLAYAEEASEGWSIVVRDVVSDTVVATHPLPDAFTWGGWNAPPVALVGDTVYVAVDDATAAVNWHTGEVTRPSYLPASTYPEIAGDVYVEDRTELPTDQGDAQWRVDPKTGEPSVSTTLVFRRLADGSEVTRGEYDDFAMASFSPNGTLALVHAGFVGDGDRPAYHVYDMTTGRRLDARLPEGSWIGWTPDDRVLSVGDDLVTTCDVLAARCQSHEVDLGKGAVKLAGTSYES